MTDREAMQMALEIIETHHGEFDYSQEIAILRASLEQPEQEPVAWMVKLGDVTCFQHHADSKYESVPLYASHPQRKPLTEDEAHALIMQDYCIGETYDVSMDLIRRVEQAHGIKGEA